MADTKQTSAKRGWPRQTCVAIRPDGSRCRNEFFNSNTRKCVHCRLLKQTPSDLPDLPAVCDDSDFFVSNESDDDTDTDPDPDIDDDDSVEEVIVCFPQPSFDTTVSHSSNANETTTDTGDDDPRNNGELTPVLSEQDFTSLFTGPFHNRVCSAPQNCRYCKSAAIDEDALHNSHKQRVRYLRRIHEQRPIFDVPLHWLDQLLHGDANADFPKRIRTIVGDFISSSDLEELDVQTNRWLSAALRSFFQCALMKCQIEMPPPAPGSSAISSSAKPQLHNPERTLFVHKPRKKIRKNQTKGHPPPHKPKKLTTRCQRCIYCRTPRCGKCDYCLKPTWKKSCPLNRCILLRKKMTPGERRIAEAGTQLT